MEIATIQLARVALKTPTEELNPRGLLRLSEFTKAMQERYHFEKIPEAAEQWRSQQGAQFLEGRFGDTRILQVVFLPGGIAVDTTLSTDASETVLNDMLGWARQSFEVVYKPRPSDRRWYYSELTFISDLSLEAMHPALRKLGETVTSAMKDQFPQPFRYEISAIILNLDETLVKSPIAPLRIERRAGVAFEDKRYWSCAPLRTRAHIDLLTEFESEIIGKNGEPGRQSC